MPTLKRFSLFLFFVVVSARASAPALAHTFTPPTEECVDYILSLPKEIERDVVEVPEDYTKPEGAKIQIFYYAKNLKKITQDKNISPIIYFNGGPGGASHGIYEYFKKNIPLAKDTPFIFIDQRGTGCSSPLPTVTLTKEGAKRIALYGTRNIVLDAEAIRKKIMNKDPKGEPRKWRAFGQSFGSAIIHRYIAIAPEGLTKTYAHGFSIMQDGIKWVEARLLSQKRVGELYRKKYIDDLPTLSSAIEQFPSNFCTGNASGKICGADMLDLLAWTRLSSPQTWEKLHKKISPLLAHDPDPEKDGKLDLEYLRKQFPAVTKEISLEDFLVAVVPTRELPGGLLNKWSCEKAMQNLAKNGEHPYEWFYNECRPILATTAPYDSFLESLAEEDYLELKDVARSLKKNTDIKLFLFSSQLDTFAPVEAYEEEVKLLNKKAKGNFSYMNFKKSGHNWMGEEKIWSLLNKSR